MTSPGETLINSVPNPQIVAQQEALRQGLVQQTLQRVGRFASRVALSLSLAVSGGVVAGTASEMAAANPTAAVAVDFANDYPNMNAEAHDVSVYEWWVDEDGDGKKFVKSGVNDELMSPRGFDYRNCTDGAAYWAEKYTGTNKVRGATWKNAEYWETAAENSGYTIKPGNTNDVEPGDIAQSNDGTWGHVGFVTEVTKNSHGAVTKIKVAELNKGGEGEFTHPEYTSKNSAGNFIRPGTDRDWDNFIDVNGTGKGLNNEPWPPAGGGGETPDKTVTALSSQITPDGVTHIYWADATGKLKESWFHNGVAHTHVIKDFVQDLGATTDITEVSSQYTSADNMQHVYAGTTGGELWEFWFNPNSGGYQGRQITDLNSEVTAMSSLITPDNVQRIFWATKNRELYETWFSAQHGQGTYLKDTSNSHIQAITAQYTQDGTRHIYWGNDEGRLHERWISNTTTGIGLMADFPDAITSLSSQRTPDGDQHVYSGDNAGQIRETWFNPLNPAGGYNTWPVRNLGSAILGIASTYTSHDGYQHIYAGSASGNLSEIWFRTGHVDGRPITLNPAPAKITVVAGAYTSNDMAQHIYWGGPDGVVRETWYGPTGQNTWNLPTEP